MTYLLQYSATIPHTYQFIEDNAYQTEQGLRGELKSRLQVKGYNGEIVKIAAERISKTSIWGFIDQAIYFFKNFFSKRYIVVDTGNEKIALNIRSCVERLGIARHEVLALESLNRGPINFDAWIVEKTIQREGIQSVFTLELEGSPRYNFEIEIINFLISKIQSGQPLPEFNEEAFSRLYFVLFKDFITPVDDEFFFLKSNINSIKEIFKVNDPALFEKTVALLLLDYFQDGDDCPEAILRLANVSHQSNSFEVIAELAKNGIFLPITSYRYNYVGLSEETIQSGQKAIFSKMVLMALKGDNLFYEGSQSVPFSTQDARNIYHVAGISDAIIDKGFESVLKQILIDSFKNNTPLSFDSYRQTVYGPLGLDLILDLSNCEELIAFELIKSTLLQDEFLDPHEYKNLYLKAGISLDLLHVDKTSIIKSVLNKPGFKEYFESIPFFISENKKLFELLGVQKYLLDRPGLAGFAQEILKSINE